MIKLGTHEMDEIGLISADKVIDGVVFRVPKTYPVYDTAYAEALDIIRDYLEEFVNLKTVGRNGMHRYNNQDHSMLTAIYAVRNLVLGGPFGAQFRTRNSPDLFRIGFKEDFEQTAAEIVGHPLFEGFNMFMRKELPFEVTEYDIE